MQMIAKSGSVVGDQRTVFPAEPTSLDRTTLRHMLCTGICLRAWLPSPPSMKGRSLPLASDARSSSSPALRLLEGLKFGYQRDKLFKLMRSTGNDAD